ncbi:MAG TPA: hypothetical protein VK982_07065, partial [Bacteroidales bacterium]|nr:hypothetical protein [Bacteroidales bacterium]
MPNKQDTLSKLEEFEFIYKIPVSEIQKIILDNDTGFSSFKLANQVKKTLFLPYLIVFLTNNTVITAP